MLEETQDLGTVMTIMLDIEDPDLVMAESQKVIEVEDDVEFEEAALFDIFAFFESLQRKNGSETDTKARGTDNIPESIFMA